MHLERSLIWRLQSLGNDDRRRSRGTSPTVVAIGAVWVAIWQIRKQERLTREQIEKQEILTREQIQATMEATQKQLEEMRKAAQPEVDIIFVKKDGSGFNYSVSIEIFNAKNIPVYVRGYKVGITWHPTVGVSKIGSYYNNMFLITNFENRYGYLESDDPDYLNLFSSDERKV